MSLEHSATFNPMAAPLPTAGTVGPAKTVHADFDVDTVLAQLTLDEKISLISGTDPWHTAAIPRLGVPQIRVTDGPNGVRGTRFFNGVPAACLPCGAYHTHLT
jgi:beta-glucosidase